MIGGWQGNNAVSVSKWRVTECAIQMPEEDNYHMKYTFNEEDLVKEMVVSKTEIAFLINLFVKYFFINNNHIIFVLYINMLCELGLTQYGAKINE